ncbi:MAG: hypothetical protein U9R15_13005 [Chloroflexota bacterium]|nr:hypothetical protein [Chloroflexota bacterium]
MLGRYGERLFGRDTHLGQRREAGRCSVLVTGDQSLAGGGVVQADHQVVQFGHGRPLLDAHAPCVAKSLANRPQRGGKAPQAGIGVSLRHAGILSPHQVEKDGIVLGHRSDCFPTGAD